MKKKMPNEEMGERMPDSETGELLPHDRAASARSHVGMPKKKQMQHPGNKRIKGQRC